MRPKIILKRLIIISLGCFASLNLVAQSPFTGIENLFSEPKSYTLFNTKTPLEFGNEETLALGFVHRQNIASGN